MSTIPTMGRKDYIHHFITTLLVFGFGFLPPFSSMTPYGMGVLGTFIGAVYGWTTIGMVYPSFVAIISLGPYAGVPEVLAKGFGSPIIVALFALLPLISVLDEMKLTQYCVNAIFFNRFSRGKPWLTLFFFFLSAFLTAFINPIVSAIIYCTFIAAICKNANITPYTKLPTALLLGTAYSIMNGQIMFPFLGTGLTFTAAYTAMFKHEIPVAQYLAFVLPIGIIMIGIFLLTMKFVLRIDVSVLNDYKIDPDTGTKLTRDQKYAVIFFALFCLAMFLSSALPKEMLLAQWLNKLTIFGIATSIICIMMLFRREDGRPFIHYQTIGQKFPWDVFLLTTFIIIISSFLTEPETGVAKTLAAMLIPLTKLPPLVFIVATMLLATIITNFANNMILTIIIMPVLVQFSSTVGLSEIGMILLLFLTTQMALATAGGSPITGIAYSMNQLINSKDMMVMALKVIPILFISLILIGLLFLQVIF